MYDVIIVGAGPAGLGTGVVLKHLGLTNFTILEKHEVGASFRRWPKEMRFISPSFMGNSFGLMDLNAIAIGTSPAFSLSVEHPSGEEFASYLRGVANHFELPVQTGIHVDSIQPLPNGAGFDLGTNAGTMRARLVVWAAGEFQYPFVDPFPGAEHCLHNTHVSSWGKLRGKAFAVVGGYESGVDAAVNLAKQGAKVQIFDPHMPWANGHPDPSVSLSPYTAERLRLAHPKGNIHFVAEAVTAVVPTKRGYELHTAGGNRYQSPTQPILATGFMGSTATLIPHLFAWHAEEGYPLLTKQDESTLTPGLFLVGPTVRHERVIFCFIYKFRQRFGVVGQAIGARLGVDTAVLETYRTHQMYLDDLSCCGDSCAC